MDMPSGGGRLLVMLGLAGLALGLWMLSGMRRRGMRQGALRLAAIVVGWLIPGGGHILLGRTGKGLFFFGLLFLTSVAGLVLADFRAVKFVWDNMFYWVGFFGSGMSLLLVELATAPDPKEWVPPRFYEVGLLYMTVAGLLNLVVMLSLPAAEETADAPAGPAPAPAAGTSAGPGAASPFGANPAAPTASAGGEVRA
ncbi:MAG: hypothetical protein HZA54_15345 [Planctomycetes bacterium]|nr:hypothetical protein [Planctomycetota bacterium]